MEHMEQPKKKKFNMQGYLIEWDGKTNGWTWNKWEYTQSADGRNRVIRRRGGLEFMKIFPSLVGKDDPNAVIPPVFNRDQVDHALKKHGIDYIFLYQGETVEESGFHTVEEAERFYQLDSSPQWTLTRYWFAYDCNMRSWCMYDAGTGHVEFTPAMAEQRAKQQPHHIEARPISQGSMMAH